MTVQKQEPVVLHGVLNIWCNLMTVQKQDPMVLHGVVATLVYLDDRSETRPSGFTLFHL